MLRLGYLYLLFARSIIQITTKYTNLKLNTFRTAQSVQLRERLQNSLVPLISTLNLIPFICID
jgi:hypothetical protein